MQVNATTPISRMEVACDADGLTSRAGTTLLSGRVDAVGLTDVLACGLTVHSGAVRHELGGSSGDAFTV